MEKHTTLAGMLEAFRNDKENTRYENGETRFGRDLEWLEGMVKRYAEKIGVSPDECTALLMAFVVSTRPEQAYYPLHDDWGEPTGLHFVIKLDHAVSRDEMEGGAE